MRAQLLSRVQPFVTPWTVAHQAPLSMGFFRQEYWSGLPFLTPGDLPDPGVELASRASSALAGRFFTTSATWGAHHLSHLRHVCVIRNIHNSNTYIISLLLTNDLLCFLGLPDHFAC